ncbi:MAG: hypothetical protein AUG51_10910 [Acidobacteria bacterium 13_1_20CM_3_53_8]|nr:MAG: hypothetical protein AUG51_10910 [Acidobacteria bacterium 13_1_20CM_3_53_8]
MRYVSPKPFNYLAALCCLIQFALAPASIEAQRQSTPARTQRASGATAQQTSSTNHSRASMELLNEVAERARSFDDLYQRAHVQALAADALWPFDRERARAIFLRAWEAAKASDDAEQEQDGREIARVTEARDEILLKAAARDSVLRERFLRELLAQENDEDNAGQNSSSSTQDSSSSSVWREPSPQSARRIELGYELLRRGNPDAAISVVMPAASEGVNASLMIFLLRLRQKYVRPNGDELLLALIEAARNGLRTNANTILLLSSPIVSPELLVIVDERGSLQLRSVPRPAMSSGDSLYLIDMDTSNGLSAARSMPSVSSAFYSVAASILLRPSSEQANAQREAVAVYFAITRLLPFFVRDAQQFVPELQARANSLAEEIETERPFANSVGSTGARANRGRAPASLPLYGEDRCRHSRVGQSAPRCGEH